MIVLWSYYDPITIIKRSYQVWNRFSLCWPLPDQAGRLSGRMGDFQMASYPSSLGSFLCSRRDRDVPHIETSETLILGGRCTFGNRLHQTPPSYQEEGERLGIDSTFLLVRRWSLFPNVHLPTRIKVHLVWKSSLAHPLRPPARFARSPASPAEKIKRHGPTGPLKQVFAMLASAWPGRPTLGPDGWFPDGQLSQLSRLFLVFPSKTCPPPPPRD